MNGDILQFFVGQPQALALYLKLEEALAQRVEDASGLPGATLCASSAARHASVTAAAVV